jgi:hypothetical protein
LAVPSRGPFREKNFFLYSIDTNNAIEAEVTLKLSYFRGSFDVVNTENEEDYAK